MQRQKIMAILHRHHIIPRHMGGTNAPENIQILTVEEHAAAHLKLYEEYGKYEDYCAYLMLSGKNKDPEFLRTRGIIGGTGCQKMRKEKGLEGPELFYGREVSNEERFKNSSKGGKIQGKINAETGHIQRISKEQSPEVRSAAGKKGAETCRKKGVNAFFDPVLRKEICSAGGKAQGRINAETDHLKNISIQYWDNVKSGKIERTTKSWYHSDQDKRSILVVHGDEVPEGYIAGRKIKW
jgi:hypothetical protein